MFTPVRIRLSLVSNPTPEDHLILSLPSKLLVTIPFLLGYYLTANFPFSSVNLFDDFTRMGNAATYNELTELRDVIKIDRPNHIIYRVIVCGTVQIEDAFTGELFRKIFHHQLVCTTNQEIIDRYLYVLQCSRNQSFKQMVLQEAISRGLYDKFQAYRQQLGPSNITVDNISGIKVVYEFFPYEEKGGTIIIEDEYADDDSV